MFPPMPDLVPNIAIIDQQNKESRERSCEGKSVDKRSFYNPQKYPRKDILNPIEFQAKLQEELTLQIGLVNNLQTRLTQEQYKLGLILKKMKFGDVNEKPNKTWRSKTFSPYDKRNPNIGANTEEPYRGNSMTSQLGPPGSGGQTIDPALLEWSRRPELRNHFWGIPQFDKFHSHTNTQTPSQTQSTTIPPCHNTSQPSASPESRPPESVSPPYSASLFPVKSRRTHWPVLEGLAERLTDRRIGQNNTDRKPKPGAAPSNIQKGALYTEKPRKILPKKCLGDETSGETSKSNIDSKESILEGNSIPQTILLDPPSHCSSVQISHRILPRIKIEDDSVSIEDLVVDEIRKMSELS